jgi:LPXTG-motif cell wall-anchored protein
VSEPLNDEVLDGLPVLADEPSGEALFPAPMPRTAIGPLTGPAQTAVVAAGGFVAGAAVLGLVHRRKSKRLALAGASSPRRIGRTGKRSKSAGELAIVGSRSLLVDVHLLGAPLRGR